jgi:hypothetical protein
MESLRLAKPQVCEFLVNLALGGAVTIDDTQQNGSARMLIVDLLKSLANVARTADFDRSIRQLSKVDFLRLIRHGATTSAASLKLDMGRCFQASKLLGCIWVSQKNDPAS